MKEVVVFNDIAGIAACTLGVSLPLLSVCDCKVYPVPTAVFSSSTRVEGVQFTSLSAFLPKVAAHWSGLPFAPDAILLGCFADAVGAEAVKPIVERFKKAGAFVMIDPVMGDEGSVFASPEHREVMRRMVRFADLTCPNFTEFCVLIGADFEQLEALPYTEKIDFIKGHVASLGVSKVIVTGVRDGAKVANFVYDNGKTDVFAHPFHHHGVCGTGDMFSNIVLAHVLWGKPLSEAVQYAGQWIAALMEEMPERPEYGMYMGGERLMALRRQVIG